MIPWHPHTEKPKWGTRAILAFPREVYQPADGEPAEQWLLGVSLYVYRKHWRNVLGGPPLQPDRRFWWCDEEDLIAHLQPRISSTENGHG